MFNVYIKRNEYRRVLHMFTHTSLEESYKSFNFLTLRILKFVLI